MSESARSGVSRRQFVKTAAAAGIAAQVGGMVGAGLAAGSDPKSATGWESFNPVSQFFNRLPFQVEGPAFQPTGTVTRPSLETDYVFGRVARFQAAIEAHPDWKPTDPIENLEFTPALAEFYRTFPERLDWDYRTFTETIPTNRRDSKTYGAYYTLANAYSDGFTSHAAYLPVPSAPPEVSDFQRYARGMRAPAPLPPRMPFKSPALAADFIKQIAHRYGATLVGITRTNLDWFYSEGWAGCSEDYDFSRLPAHWQYAIVIGVPMEWDVLLSSPQSSTSYEAYDRVSTAAIRLEGALKALGYAARTNSPMTSYDLIVPPFAVEAGLGELSRPGYCVTPELGSNCRMAIVVTDLPMAVDKPIHFGVREFCNRCRICAEQCPSGAISLADSPRGMTIRGYEHWYINNGACYNFWRESMGPTGCRLCVANCPYSRKDNWIHALARTVDPRDPTGMTRESLIFMQKKFFEHPSAEEYRRVGGGEGRFASYRPEPAWLRTETYLDIPVTAPPR